MGVVAMSAGAYVGTTVSDGPLIPPGCREFPVETAATIKLSFRKDSYAADIFEGGTTGTGDDNDYQFLADQIVQIYNNITDDCFERHQRRMLNCSHEYTERTIQYDNSNDNTINNTSNDGEEYIHAYWTAYVVCNDTCPSLDPLFGLDDDEIKPGRRNNRFLLQQQSNSYHYDGLDLYDPTSTTTGPGDAVFPTTNDSSSDDNDQNLQFKLTQQQQSTTPYTKTDSSLISVTAAGTNHYKDTSDRLLQVENNTDTIPFDSILFGDTIPFNSMLFAETLISTVPEFSELKRIVAIRTTNPNGEDGSSSIANRNDAFDFVGTVVFDADKPELIGTVVSDNEDNAGIDETSSSSNNNDNDVESITNITNDPESVSNDDGTGSGSEADNNVSGSNEGQESGDSGNGHDSSSIDNTDGDGDPNNANDNTTGGSTNDEKQDVTSGNEMENVNNYDTKSEDNSEKEEEESTGQDKSQISAVEDDENNEDNEQNVSSDSSSNDPTNLPTAGPIMATPSNDDNNTTTGNELENVNGTISNDDKNTINGNGTISNDSDLENGNGTISDASSDLPLNDLTNLPPTLIPVMDTPSIVDENNTTSNELENVNDTLSKDAVSILPTSALSSTPAATPSAMPSTTRSQTVSPTSEPSVSPTKAPTRTPTKQPTKSQSRSPTKQPTKKPSRSPSRQ